MIEGLMGKQLVRHAVLFALTLCIASQALADDPKIPESGTAFSTYLADVITKGMWLEPKTLEENEVPDAVTKATWAGSRFTPTSDIKEVLLKFDIKNKEWLKDLPPSKDRTPESFEFRISFVRGGLNMVHSKGADQLARGLRSNISYAENRPPIDFYFNGLGDSDLYIVLPVIKDPTHTWGLAVCPRLKSVQIDKKDNRTTRMYLSESPFELVEAKMNLTAEFKGKMESSFQVGKVDLDLVPSPGIPKARLGVNEDEGIDPRVELQYTPVEPFGFYKVDAATGSHEGLFTRFLMQNQSGYIKEYHYGHMVLIDKIAGHIWNSRRVNGNMISGDTGDCYSIVVVKSLTEHFRKG